MIFPRNLNKEGETIQCTCLQNANAKEENCQRSNAERKSRYGPRQFLKDMAALPVLKKAVQSLTGVRDGLSHLLLLDVYVLKTLGQPNPKKYGAHAQHFSP